MNILLTGATGLIGQRIVRRLSREGHKIYLLVRPQSKSKAIELFSDVPTITYIEGDIEDKDVVKNIYTVSQLLDEIEGLVHLAAFYDLEASLEEAYLKNVLGTQNILHLMSKMKSIKYFHYFSTYAVNPTKSGLVSENDLTENDLLFEDHYSKTKNHAEHLVRRHNLNHIHTVIHRPGIIIGDSNSGVTTKHDGVYFFYDFVRQLKKMNIMRLKIPYLPMLVHENSYLPVLPVDTLTDWSCHIISHPPQENMKTYHLVPTPSIRTKDFLEASMKLLGVPMKLFPLGQVKVITPLLPFLKIPKEAAFYMNQLALFDRTNLEKDYPELTCKTYDEYLPKIIKAYLESKE
jgi:nucleoside-diphosphate-sugar epimerase